MKTKGADALAESGLRKLIVDYYDLVYRRTPKAVEVLTVFERDRLLRPPTGLTCYVAAK